MSWVIPSRAPMMRPPPALFTEGAQPSAFVRSQGFAVYCGAIGTKLDDGAATSVARNELARHDATSILRKAAMGGTRIAQRRDYLARSAPVVAWSRDPRGAPILALLECPQFAASEPSIGADCAELVAVWIPIGAWITAAIVLLTNIAMIASARQRRMPTGLVFSVLVAAPVELVSVGAIWLIATVTERCRLDGSPLAFRRRVRRCGGDGDVAVADRAEGRAAHEGRARRCRARVHTSAVICRARRSARTAAEDECRDRQVASGITAPVIARCP